MLFMFPLCISLCCYKRKIRSIFTLGYLKCRYTLLNSLGFARVSSLSPPFSPTKSALLCNSAAVSRSAKHNDTRKRDLSCHAKISLTTSLHPLPLFLFLSSSTPGILPGEFSPRRPPTTVTCWFHRWGRASHRQESGRSQV